MKLDQHNTYTRVSSCTPEELTWLQQFLVFENSNARFTGGLPYIPMFNSKSRTFASGFTPILQQECVKHGFSIEVLESRKKPDILAIQTPDYSHLRPYQLQGVRTFLERERGIVQVATGGGKGWMITAIGQAFTRGNGLILTHRENLLIDLKNRYEDKTGRPCGVIAKGKWAPNNHYTIAMIKTLKSKLKNSKVLDWLKTIDYVVLDECHIAAGKTVREIFRHLPNAYYKYGFSATPLARGDHGSAYVIGLFGPIIFKRTARQLINDGYLSEPTCRFVDYLCYYPHPVSTGAEYKKMYREMLIQSHDFNYLISEIMKIADKPGFVFVLHAEHGVALQQMATELGIKTCFVDQHISPHGRMEAVERLKRGEHDFIISTVVLQEGLDFPETKSVILAKGGVSWIQELQMIGRGSRITATKNTFQVWDILFQGVPMLFRQSKTRVKALQAETYPIQVGTLAQFQAQLGYL